MADLERWAGKRVLLDTNATLFYLADVEAFRDAVQALFREMASGNVPGAASVAAEAEVRGGPQAAHREAAGGSLTHFSRSVPTS